MEYLSLPLVLRKGYFKTTDVRSSITDSIGLILGTRRGSLPFDPEYGCDLWEQEYADLYRANKSDVQSSIREAIARNEQRLYNISVSMKDMPTTSPTHPLGIAVVVIGNYRDGDAEKRFEERFTIG